MYKRDVNLTPKSATDLMTVMEIASLFRISRRQVERFIKAGHLPKYKLGRRTLLKRRDVLAFLKKCR